MIERNYIVIMQLERDDSPTFAFPPPSPFVEYILVLHYKLQFKIYNNLQFEHGH